MGENMQILTDNISERILKKFVGKSGDVIVRLKNGTTLSGYLGKEEDHYFVGATYFTPNDCSCVIIMKAPKVEISKNKVSRRVTIRLETDGDYCFMKDKFRLPNPEYIDILEIGDNMWIFDIYSDKDNPVWKDGDWCDYLAANVVETFISNLSVSSTHLYLWKDFVKISEQVRKWALVEKDKIKNSWCLSGNYEGTQFKVERLD